MRDLNEENRPYKAGASTQKLERYALRSDVRELLR